MSQTLEPMNDSTIRGIGAFVEPQSNTALSSEVCRVLVVDDDPAVCRLIASILDSAGYGVEVAFDGGEAMQRIADNPPEFLLTDWEMPEYNGLSLCQWIREQPLADYLYIILVTGNSQTKHMVQAISAGADDFMTKPVQPGELLARIQAGQRIIELQRRLYFLATHDQLTGLLGRRPFFEILEQKFRQAMREDCPLACVMIDIDCFKAINDEHGHQSGDDVLAAVAGVLKEKCRQGDSICRYGGEEFCVLLVDCDGPETVEWAEQCRASISEIRCINSDKNMCVTASFGVSTNMHNPENAKQFIHMADSALLRAKRSGKNRVLMFDGERP